MLQEIIIKLQGATRIGDLGLWYTQNRMGGDQQCILILNCLEGRVLGKAPTNPAKRSCLGVDNMGPSD